MRRLALALVLALTVSACGSGGGSTPDATPSAQASRALPADMRSTLEKYLTLVRAGRPTCRLRAQKLLEAESGKTGSAALRACRRRKQARETGYPPGAAGDARLLSASGGRARVSVPAEGGARRFLLVREHDTWKVLGIGRAAR
jgi:hypothetical protein